MGTDDTNATPTGLTRPRWTHVALPSLDIDRTVEWYETFTPLEVVARFEDDMGKNAWMSNPDQVEDPFVLVLVMFYADEGKAQPQLAPFAHLGVELPEKEQVDHYADLAREAGCLALEPQQLPPPIGYVCMVSDPDGNRIEYSYGQQVFEKVRERWGSKASA